MNLARNNLPADDLNAAATKVVELKLLLPTPLFLALEQAAFQQNLSVGHMLRRTFSDFLRQPCS
jgi:hypothetical protein